MQLSRVGIAHSTPEKLDQPLINRMGSTHPIYLAKPGRIPLLYSLELRGAGMPVAD
jgi:hypothetical protein